MRFALVILPDAITDIVEAARWYNRQREGLGTEFTIDPKRDLVRDEPGS